MSLHESLELYFGHTEFRPFQEEIITQVMEGRDTLGVLPTGAGKSLTYQLPSLLLPRPTLVISPLIALMQDQLNGLPPAVYPYATLINSSVESEELKRRLNGIENGEFKLIYAAPERLRQQNFLRLLHRVGLSLVVVDEAHCVSAWGHDFRPDYLFIRKALETFQESGDAPTLLALTATATQEMQAEIAAQLGRDLKPINAPIFRSNLKLEVFRCANAERKMRRLSEICKETSGSAIVYANSRNRCEELSEFLNRLKIPAAYYHAGMEREERKATQERFMLGRVRIMVATVAFGMGVDKANVRLVVHFTLPESLESYTQEAGRAGRDGKPSRCALLAAPSDKTNLSRWLHQGEVTFEMARDTYRALKARLGRGTGLINVEEILPEAFGEDALEPGADTRLRVAISLLEQTGFLIRHPDMSRDLRIEMLPAPPNARTNLEKTLALRRKHAAERLEEMVGYVESKECRHVIIARHFGQKQGTCESACDRCLGLATDGKLEKTEVPTFAQIPDVGRILMECMASLPFAVGRTGLAKIVTGAPDASAGQGSCKHHGMLVGFTRKAVIAFLDTLVERKYLIAYTTEDYPKIRITATGGAALQSEETILANPNHRTAHPSSRSPKRIAPSTIRPSEKTSTPMTSETPFTPDEDDRFEQLRAWRRIEAERAHTPPYVIFHDSTLRSIARANPSSLNALVAVSGVGQAKQERYGAAILELLHPPDA
ncbi:hypothetical protein LBMAG21_09450 [Armatimonadota bacterium]|nr:hypothetical protein LBMAG21_09450 [Armatimonadota bacterium]